MPYLLALAITQLVEVPIYLVVFTYARVLPGWRGPVAAIGVNLVTHPVVWLVLTGHSGRWWFVAVEAAVVLTETALLFAWIRRDGFVLLLTAIVANTASILGGLALSRVPVA